jgi:NADH dehydrogenase [ubiquinone] 1 alpha subcomplex assembly factor 7
VLFRLFFDFAESSKPLLEKLIPIVENIKVGDEIEMSYNSLMTMDLLSKIVSRSGGAIMNIDYGNDGAFSDSIRAIKEHKYVPSPYFWQIPGECDLSAYVNFSALGQFAEVDMR